MATENVTSKHLIMLVVEHIADVDSDRESRNIISAQPLEGTNEVSYAIMGGKEGSKLLEGEYESYHVLAHPLSLFPGPCANLTVHIETCVSPTEHFL